jgi:L-fucose isomerase-like protein
MYKTVLIQFIRDLIKALKAFWFQCLTKARFDLIEIENKIEAEAERQERFEPVYQEKKVDDELQTGESRKLGGEMRLAAKWVIEAEERLGRGEP